MKNDGFDSYITVHELIKDGARKLKLEYEINVDELPYERNKKLVERKR